jgi:hypothetical protein
VNEEPDVSQFGTELADAVVAALPVWTARCLDRFLVDVPHELVAATGVEAVRLVEEPLRALLAMDIDAQRGSPLAIVRGAVAAPTELLQAAGVDPVERDPFTESAFPGDVYDLSPASWSDIDESVAEPGLRWSVAKAYAHRRRHASD